MGFAAPAKDSERFGGEVLAVLILRLTKIGIHAPVLWTSAIHSRCMLYAHFAHNLPSTK